MSGPTLLKKKDSRSLYRPTIFSNIFSSLCQVHSECSMTKTTFECQGTHELSSPLPSFNSSGKPPFASRRISPSLRFPCTTRLVILLIFFFLTFPIFLSVISFPPLELPSYVHPVHPASLLPHQPFQSSNSSSFHNDTRQESRIWPYQPQAGPFQCTLITSSSNAHDEPYPFNARSFCVARSLCLSSVTPSQNAPSVYVDAIPDQIPCVAYKPDLTTLLNPPQSCLLVQKNVLCANGRYYAAALSHCPSLKSFTQTRFSSHQSVEKIHSDVVVVIPAYMFLGNVYHFSFVAANSMFVSAAIPQILQNYYGPHVHLPMNNLKLTLLFRGQLPHEYGLWHRGIIEAMVTNRLRKMNMSVEFETLNERRNGSSRTVCMQNAVLIGKRHALALWPFPNSSDITSPEALAVPVDAIAFRRAAYDFADVPTSLPDLPAGVRSSPPLLAASDLPGKIIGYARRNTESDPLPGSTLNATTRRFNDADETWFVSLLRRKAAERAYEYRTLQPSENMTFVEQVRMFADVGVIIGIHGANLVNSIFARPFSALFEISPVDSPCYLAGANSGLRYWRLEPRRKGTLEESFCRSKGCRQNPKMRRIVIEHEEDRRDIESIVDQMLDYIDSLHKSQKSTDQVWKSDLAYGFNGTSRNSFSDLRNFIPMSYDVDTSSYRRVTVP